MSKKASGNRNRKAPFGPDQFTALDNEIAKRPIPSEIADWASRPRISLWLDDDVDLTKAVKDLDDGTREIELPHGAGLVRPGSGCERVSYGEIRDGINKRLTKRERRDPFRPAWVDYTPHEKTGAGRLSAMHRVDGTLYEPEWVYGSDDRSVYYPSGYPWICIGKIYAWEDFSNPNPAWSGSGVLIGDRVVLTCGHNVPWGSSNWAMQFVPSYYDGTSTLGAGVTSYVSDARGYDTGGVSAWDMAVLRLYNPLGRSYGYFGTKNYSSSWEGGNYWTLAGYPGAIAGASRPSRQMWWPVIDDDGSGAAEEVEYRADSSAGNSGGPVFGFWDGMPYAIATHSGGQKSTFLWWTLEDNNVGAGGGALNSLVSWARSNWP